MGLDVGDARIGVAISDPLGIIAQPLSVIERTNLDQDVSAVRTLVVERDIARIVVGMPLDESGRCGPQAAKVLAFVARLREAINAEVVTQDERFTTALAERAMISAGTSRRKRRRVIDKVAAQQILQTYLDRMKTASSRE
jgi:putative Holliday junction resolvase